MLTIAVVAVLISRSLLIRYKSRSELPVCKQASQAWKWWKRQGREPMREHPHECFRHGRWPDGEVYV